MKKNTQHAKKVLFTLFAMLMPLLIDAQTKVEIGGIWYNLIAKAKQAEVTYKGSSYSEYTNEYSGSITIPATVNYEGVNYSVTSIGNYAFEDCSSLTSITIPESVTSIGDYAFEDCSRLTSITIPESVTSIGNYAFYNCYNLTSINIPQNSQLKSIEFCAFQECHSLTAITIPQSVTNIGSGAFVGCHSLTAVHIYNIVNWCNIEILPGAYYSSECNPLYYAKNLYLNGELVTNLTIPEGVTNIKKGIFAGGSFTTITLPKSVTSIGEQAFMECSSLTAINIPESVTSIGEYAFWGCSSLAAITLPENSQLTSIEGGAFWGCSSLAAITLPENSQLTSIEGGVFRDCSSLTAINIPEGVTSIGSSAFRGCSSLTAINIPEGVTSIGDLAFNDCSSLTAINIPASVTSIGEYAFRNCSSLTAIVLPKNLEYINSQAFANCAELLDVYCYAEEVPSTKSDAFDGSYPEYITLHVPASALNAYKSTAPWSSFGNIVELGAAITRITLDKTSTILTEGEELTINITTTPSNADRNLISWSSSNPSVATVDNAGKVTAVAPGTATITATANDGSGVSASCEVTVNELILGKCATPTISYKDGEVIFACDTEEVTFISETTEDIAGNRNNAKFAIVPTYTITAYTTKEHYEDSDVATLTLCWLPCTEEHESEETGILTIPTKPVLISTQGGTITLNGISDDTEVVAYDLAGNTLGEATATGGAATLTTNLTKGDIVIVKIGNNSIKIAIK